MTWCFAQTPAPMRTIIGYVGYVINRMNSHFFGCVARGLGPSVIAGIHKNSHLMKYNIQAA
jgi:hypothetical protein